MDVIETARQLGVAIQQDGRYIALMKAKAKNDEDKELQDMIGKLNLIRMQYGSEAGKDDKDDKKLDELGKQFNELYEKIMRNENMDRYSKAKNEVDSMMNYINQILMMSVNGDDPMTAEPSSCGGDCSGCSGCH